MKLASLEQEVAEFPGHGAKRSRGGNRTAAQRHKVTTWKRSEPRAKWKLKRPRRAARVELKALAAKLAVDGAKSLVSQQMTPGVQDALINKFVQSLQGRPN